MRRPAWLVPGAVTLILGAIVVGNHRVHGGPVLAIGPGAAGIAF